MSLSVVLAIVSENCGCLCTYGALMAITGPPGQAHAPGCPVISHSAPHRPHTALRRQLRGQHRAHSLPARAEAAHRNTLQPRSWHTAQRQPEPCWRSQAGSSLRVRVGSAAVADPPAPQQDAGGLAAAARLLEDSGAARDSLLLVSGHEVTVRSPQGADEGQVLHVSVAQTRTRRPRLSQRSLQVLVELSGDLVATAADLENTRIAPIAAGRGELIGLALWLMEERSKVRFPCTTCICCTATAKPAWLSVLLNQASAPA